MKKRILVICEKPKAARRIAEALDDHGRPERHYDNDVPYYIVTHGDETLIVVAALGHLYTISQKGGKWTYPSFEYHWVPRARAWNTQLRLRGTLVNINARAVNLIHVSK